MDRRPRPTPRTTSNAHKRSRGDVDYGLLHAVGIESPDDYDVTVYNFDPNPGSVIYEPQPSYNIDPDTCPGCGHFHYGKQHTRKDHPEPAPYVYFGSCPNNDCRNEDCNNLSHWIETGYIQAGSIKTELFFYSSHNIE